LGAADTNIIEVHMGKDKNSPEFFYIRVFYGG